MPIISIFFGIVIRMFYNDHDPPHFHAEYQGQRGKFDLDGEIVVGDVHSRTARAPDQGVATLHRGEIEANWERMRAGRALERIPPLE